MDGDWTYSADGDHWNNEPYPTKEEAISKGFMHCVGRTYYVAPIEKSTLNQYKLVVSTLKTERIDKY